MLDPQVVLLTILVSMTTGLGALPALSIKGTSHWTRDALVGISAGLMLSLTTLNLIPEALGQTHENLTQVVAGIALGSLTLLVADTDIPHIDGLLIPDKPLTKGMRSTLMMIAAIIHNFPEASQHGQHTLEE